VRDWETSLYSQTYITHMGTKTLMVQASMHLLNCRMLFADTFIQIIYNAFKICVLSVHAFLGNQTHP